jgi:hypothetical protein
MGELMFTNTFRLLITRKNRRARRVSFGTDPGLVESLENRRLLSATINTLAVLGPDQGSNPREVISDPAGNLYGIAAFADGSEGSTIFEIAATGSNGNARVIWSSLGKLSTNPPTPSGLVVDASGNLYGNLTNGTPSPFKIAAGTTTLTAIAAIPADAVGTSVPKQVTDSSGNVFGTTTEGGDLSLNAGKGDGTVYEIPAGSKTKVTLVTFEGSNGANPNVALALDAVGNVYGTTQSVATYDNPEKTLLPTIFEIPAQTHKLATLETLSSNTASASNLFVTPTGSVVGSTSTGHFGSVFQIVPDPSEGPPLGGTQSTLTLATPAHATPAVVTGKSVQLNALGTSSDGPSGLTYTWSPLTAPAGAKPPTFSVNGNNAAATTAATFHKNGTYAFRCTITDGNGHSVTTDVTVLVSQTASTLKTTPTTSVLHQRKSMTFHTVVDDQFGNPLRTQPAVRYTKISGPITVNRSSGRVTAQNKAGAARIRVTMCMLSELIRLSIA